MSLGICNCYIDKKSIIWSISSISLTIALSIMNFGIGIPIFGTQFPGGIIIQLLIIFLIQQYITFLITTFQVLSMSL